MSKTAHNARPCMNCGRLIAMKSGKRKACSIACGGLLHNARRKAKGERRAKGGSA